MKKEVTAVFTLTEKEIKEALYDQFVKKLKESNIHSVFDPGTIKIELDSHDHLNVSLTIKEEKEL